MKNQDYDYRLPRLFVEGDLAESADLPLDEDSAHYLKNVLRRPDGSQLRVFNGRDGEYLAVFKAKDRKNHILSLGKQTRPQPARARALHLAFALIKKDRQDFMIEKAVELGVTHFHPVLTHQTVIRELNTERTLRQIREAAEQCERLDIPALRPLVKLDAFAAGWDDATPLYAALEREEVPALGRALTGGACGILIGPEGGFSETEREGLLKDRKITAVGLGDQILRAETAAIFGLSVIASGCQR